MLLVLLNLISLYIIENIEIVKGEQHFVCFLPKTILKFGALFGAPFFAETVRRQARMRQENAPRDGGVEMAPFFSPTSGERACAKN